MVSNCDDIVSEKVVNAQLKENGKGVNRITLKYWGGVNVGACQATPLHTAVNWQAKIQKLLRKRWESCSQATAGLFLHFRQPI
jgi:hypothetical protein